MLHKSFFRKIAKPCVLFEVPLYVLSASKFGDPRSYADGSTAFVSTAYFSFVLQLSRSYAVCNRHRYYQNNNRTMLAACVHSLRSFYQNNSIRPSQESHVDRTCLTRGWGRRWFAFILVSTYKPTRKRSRAMKNVFLLYFWQTMLDPFVLANQLYGNRLKNTSMMLMLS